MPHSDETVISNSAAVLRKDGIVAVITEYLGLVKDIVLVVDGDRNSYSVEHGGRAVLLIENASEESMQFFRGVDSVSIYETQSSGKGFICHFGIPLRPKAR